MSNNQNEDKNPNLKEQAKDMVKSPGMWIFFGAMLMIFVFVVATPPPNAPAEDLSFSKLLKHTQDKTIEKVEVMGEFVRSTIDGKQFITLTPEDNSKLVDSLAASGIEVEVKKKPEPGFFARNFGVILIVIAIVGITIWMVSQQKKMQGRSGKMDKMKLDPEKQIETGITFADVAGIDEAKEDVTELVDFLKTPEKFTEIGGRIPSGALMVGPPGCGKTLLAKAVAGEAGVPFFSLAGSDFVEMFAGVGASRVRDVFKKAKESAPCIVFIDEIDAVGKKRGSELGGNGEREQTLNQMLVEMDGFEQNSGVIIIAATNRPETLDDALKRSGRFDREIHVSLPDMIGREKILGVHGKKIKLANNVDLSVIAKGTPGFSGADLEKLMNESALQAVRNGHDVVMKHDIELAKDKIMMGSERKTFTMTDTEKAITAYHEAGHAIVGLMTPEHDPVHKVSIIPRGRALGVTMYLPEGDRVSYSKQRLLSQLESLMGGRAAEEMIYGALGVTTGASNDIERATDLARRMVTEFGLSELGTINYAIPQSFGATKPFSERTAEDIDEAVKHLVDTAYNNAKKILKKYTRQLHDMSNMLIEHETIDSDQIKQLMEDTHVWTKEVI